MPTVVVAFHPEGTQWAGKLQFHHVFPKAFLKASYNRREADDIANLCFIGCKTNRQISDKSPVQYFPGIKEVAGATVFEAQCIQTDAAKLAVDDYKAFLTARRAEIAARLNEFLGS